MGLRRSPDSVPSRVDVTEQQFTSAFENAAIGMALIAPDDRRLHVNKALCAMLGYTEAELLQLSGKETTHPDDVGEDRRQRSLLLGGLKDSYAWDKRFIHKQGHVFWVHFICSLVRAGDGTPLQFISQVKDITERKLAEQALLASEERFRSLAMLSSDWYWEQDQDFRFAQRIENENVEGWLLDPANFIGKCRWELPGFFPLANNWAQHRATLEAHQPFRDFEYMRVVGQEPPRYLSTSGEPVFDTEGVFTGYRGTARDITERWLAEQRLRDAQALLHMAAQVGRLGAWAYDRVQPRITYSEEVCAIHEVRQGYAPTLRQALAFFAPAYRSPMRGIMRRCLRDGSPFDVEAQIVTAKGRPLWVRVIGEAEWDAQGRVRRIQGAFQDISGSRQAAENARLVAEQLTTTLESLTDAFFTLNRQWIFSYVNTEAERLLNHQRADLLGRNIWETFPEFHGSAMRNQFEQAMDQNVTVQFDKLYQLNGMWSQVKAYPSRQGLAVYVKDITGRLAAEREILRLNAELEGRVKRRTAQLEAANKELESFSYSIAHDLRAPLSSIEGFSQMLAKTAGPELGDRCRHYLDRIRAGVKQMGDLTDGLLALANLSRGSLLWEPVNLAALAGDAIASCRERTPGRAVNVRIASSLPVLGDPRLLAQVMGNLVSNAWKFTSKQPAAAIEIGSMAGADGSTVYFVRDNGAGFDVTYAARMFEAFQRMHTAAEFEGTGIGLAIVQKIIARHGGRIWGESTPLQGASFYFTLGVAAS